MPAPQAGAGADSISSCPPCLDWCLMGHSCVGYSALRPYESCFESVQCVGWNDATASVWVHQCKSQLGQRVPAPR